MSWEKDKEIPKEFYTREGFSKVFFLLSMAEFHAGEKIETVIQFLLTGHCFFLFKDAANLVAITKQATFQTDPPSLFTSELSVRLQMSAVDVSSCPQAGCQLTCRNCLLFHRNKNK